MYRPSLPALVALVILGVLPESLVGQDPVELRGRVLDDVSGTPLAGVIVRLPDEARYTLTDDTGAFRFTDVAPGTQRIVAMRLGFHDQAADVGVDGQTSVTLRLAPRPVELEAIVVTTTDHMDRLATARASALSREDRFWQTFDRDDILRSGTDDPIEFLNGSTNLVIRPCRGVGADSSQLCLLGGGWATGPQGLAATTGLIGPASGSGSSAPSYRRRLLIERMRTSSQAAAVWGQRVRPGSIYGRARVFLDDLPLPGSLDELSEYSLRDVHRVEAYGLRGERQIRFYTAGYLSLVELGLVRPDFAIPARDEYEPWGEPDWPPDRGPSRTR